MLGPQASRLLPVDSSRRNWIPSYRTSRVGRRGRLRSQYHAPFL